MNEHPPRKNGERYNAYAAKLNISPLPGQSPREAAWSMSEERQFMEKLVSDRFYYFMVIYTLIILGALSATTKAIATTICVFGFIICLLMTIALCQVGQKLSVILSILHRTENHPVRIVGRIHRARYNRTLDDANQDDHIFAKPGDDFDSAQNPHEAGVQGIIAFVIPVLSTLFLGILSVLLYNEFNIITK